MQPLSRSLSWPKSQSTHALNLTINKKHLSNHSDFTYSPFNTFNIYTRTSTSVSQNREHKPLVYNHITATPQYIGSSDSLPFFRPCIPSGESDNGSITANMHFLQFGPDQPSLQTEEKGKSNVLPCKPRMTLKDIGSPNQGIEDSQILAAQLRKLTEMRSSINRTRLQAHDCRTMYKMERESAHILKLQLLEESSLFAINNDFNGPFPKRDWFARLRESDDKLAPLEAKLDEIEDKLLYEEWELKEEEHKIYECVQSSVLRLLNVTDGVLSRDDNSDEEQIPQNAHQERTGHVDSFLLAEVRARRADANIYRNRLSELVREYDQHLEKQDEGHGLDEASQAEVLEYPHRWDELRRKIEAIEDEISRMTDAPFKLGQFTTDSHDCSPVEVTRMPDALQLPKMFEPLGFQILELECCNPHEELYGSDRDTTDEDHEIERLNKDFDSYHDYDGFDRITRQDAPQTLQLLFPDDDASPCLPAYWYERETDLAQEPEIFGKVDYVNAWLLNRLRRSPIEIRRLKSATGSVSLNLDHSEFKDLAIEWWFKDASIDDFKHACLKAVSTRLSAMTAQSACPDRRTQSDPGSANALRPKEGFPRGKWRTNYDRTIPWSQ